MFACYLFGSLSLLSAQMAVRATSHKRKACPPVDESSPPAKRSKDARSDAQRHVEAWLAAHPVADSPTQSLVEALGAYTARVCHASRLLLRSVAVAASLGFYLDYGGALPQAGDHLFRARCKAACAQILLTPSDKHVRRFEHFVRMVGYAWDDAHGRPLMINLLAVDVLHKVSYAQLSTFASSLAFALTKAPLKPDQVLAVRSQAWRKISELKANAVFDATKVLNSVLAYAHETFKECRPKAVNRPPSAPPPPIAPPACSVLPSVGVDAALRDPRDAPVPLGAAATHDPPAVVAAAQSPAAAAQSPAAAAQPPAAAAQPPAAAAQPPAAAAHPPAAAEADGSGVIAPTSPRSPLAISESSFLRFGLCCPSPSGARLHMRQTLLDIEAFADALGDLSDDPITACAQNSFALRFEDTTGQLNELEDTSASQAFEGPVLLQRLSLVTPERASLVAVKEFMTDIRSRCAQISLARVTLPQGGDHQLLPSDSEFDLAPFRVAMDKAQRYAQLRDEFLQLPRPPVPLNPVDYGLDNASAGLFHSVPPDPRLLAALLESLHVPPHVANGLLFRFLRCDQFWSVFSQASSDSPGLSPNPAKALAAFDEAMTTSGPDYCWVPLADESHVVRFGVTTWECSFHAINPLRPPLQSPADAETHCWARSPQRFPSFSLPRISVVVSDDAVSHSSTVAYFVRPDSQPHGTDEYCELLKACDPARKSQPKLPPNAPAPAQPLLHSLPSAPPHVHHPSPLHALALVSALPAQPQLSDAHAAAPLPSPHMHPSSPPPSPISSWNPRLPLAACAATHTSMRLVRLQSGQAISIGSATLHRAILAPNVAVLSRSVLTWSSVHATISSAFSSQTESPRDRLPIMALDPVGTVLGLALCEAQESSRSVLASTPLMLSAFSSGARAAISQLCFRLVGVYLGLGHAPQANDGQTSPPSSQTPRIISTPEDAAKELSRIRRYVDIDIEFLRSDSNTQ